MRDVLIRLLFRLLGHTYTRQFNIPYLFGASQSSHAARKKRWERALMRMYRDKDLLDFLYYQAESDKENAWRGKVDPQLSRGARLRTLFIVYSARRAHELDQKGRADSPTAASKHDAEMKRLSQAYKDMTDIGDSE